MNIAIIGAGDIGMAVASLFKRSGHTVVLGSQRQLDAQQSQGMKVLRYREAALNSDIACFCIPWEFSESAAAQLGDLQGKILIDVSNPDADGPNLAIGHSTSGAEVLAARVPSARVVKAFNYIYAELLLDGEALARVSPSIFYCGDDASAQVEVGNLIQSCGLEPVDCGPLMFARYLEPMAMLMVQLVHGQGFPPDGIAMRLSHPKNI